MPSPKDNILRALIDSKIEGDVGLHLVHVIDRGDFYLVVVNWACHEEKEGWFPRQSVCAPKEEFVVVDHPDYELRCKRFVDFDLFFTSEPTVMDADEAWSRPDELSLPPPDEDKV